MADQEVPEAALSEGAQSQPAGPTYEELQR